MAKQGIPWSIKGISTEATQLARARAQAANVTVGTWLSEVIRLVAASERTGDVTGPVIAPGFAAAAPDLGAPDLGAPDLGSPEFAARVDDLQARLEEADTDTQITMDELEAAIRRLERRWAAGR
jgi:hypothetical protein